MSGKESPNIERSDKAILLDVSISVLSHILVCGRNDDFNEAKIHRKSNQIESLALHFLYIQS